LPYKPKKIETIKIVESDIEYSKKYVDRSEIDKLLNQNRDFDEILIAKDGFLTDTSIANIALLINGVWKTPKKPLLYGTTRQRLIKQNLIIQSDLKIEDLKIAQGFALLNAMIGFTRVSLHIFL
jgi:4-amino-4-deoxychorismate lyase